MRGRTPIAAALLACVVMGASAQPTAAPQAPVGELKPLGNDRFQIGRIVVDKRHGRFTVPGRVHLLDKPLEYLASAPGGMKEYETLLVVEASGTEFNLACILLGLERDPAQSPAYQFSQQPLAGPRVAISIGWQDGDARRQVPAAEALLEQGADTKPEAVEWVYTGSIPPTPQTPFAADVTGTLVGFVHDPNTVIDAVRGLGIGAYGSVNGNSTLLPPVGTAVELVVEVARAAATKAQP